MRAAWDAGDVTTLLGLVFREIRCRDDAERAEVLYYRAFTCCAFADRIDTLRRWHLPFAERAVVLMQEQRHPLLFRALWSAAQAYSHSGDPATATSRLLAARALPCPDTYWRLVTDLNLVPQFIGTGNCRALAPPTQQLRCWYDQAQRNSAENPGLLFAAATSLADVALVTGAPQESHPYLLTLCDLGEAAATAVIKNEKVTRTHSCSLATERIRKYHVMIQRLAWVGALVSLVARLRELRQIVTTLPHTCDSAEYFLCTSLAEAALAFGAPSTRIFARAALCARQRIRSPSPPHEDWFLHKLLLRMGQTAYRPLRGEVAELLAPEAWPLWTEGAGFAPDGRGVGGSEVN